MTEYPRNAISVLQLSNLDGKECLPYALPKDVIMSLVKKDEILKEIVGFIHESLKKKKSKTEPFSAEMVDHKKLKISVQKVGAGWPLKRGSVEKNILAWNVSEDQNEVISAFIAFSIKNYAIQAKNSSKKTC